MANKPSTLKVFLILLCTLPISFLIYSLTLTSEFCPVIDDTRMVDAIAAVNKFNDAKISYFVDFQNSYQILVDKNQIDVAYVALDEIGIITRSNYQSVCKVVH
jgi:hypothetical protein